MVRGFLAFWAPGGLGVREAVFIAAMEFALPVAVLHGPLATAGDKYLFLIFLSVLLRIWATVGELILAGLAYLFDLRGALGLQGTEGFRRPHVSAEGPTSGEEPRPRESAVWRNKANVGEFLSHPTQVTGV